MPTGVEGSASAVNMWASDSVLLKTTFLSPAAMRSSLLGESLVLEYAGDGRRSYY